GVEPVDVARVAQRHVPEAGEIRLPVGQPRRGRGQIRAAVALSWHVGCGITQPLGDAARGQSDDRDEDEPEADTTHTPLHINGVSMAPAAKKMSHTTRGPVMLDRRQLMTGVVASLLGSLVLPRRSAAQQTGLLALTDRLVLVTSGGPNVLAFASPDGLVLVDSGAPDRSDALMATLRASTSGARPRTLRSEEHTAAL